jgi:hypothetical protein
MAGDGTLHLRNADEILADVVVRAREASLPFTLMMARPGPVGLSTAIAPAEVEDLAAALSAASGADDEVLRAGPAHLAIVIPGRGSATRRQAMQLARSAAAEGAPLFSWSAARFPHDATTAAGLVQRAKERLDGDAAADAGDDVITPLRPAARTGRSGAAAVWAGVAAALLVGGAAYAFHGSGGTGGSAGGQAGSPSTSGTTAASGSMGGDLSGADLQASGHTAVSGGSGSQHSGGGSVSGTAGAAGTTSGPSASTGGAAGGQAGSGTSGSSGGSNSGVGGKLPVGIQSSTPTTLPLSTVTTVLGNLPGGTSAGGVLGSVGSTVGGVVGTVTGTVGGVLGTVTGTGSTGTSSGSTGTSGTTTTTTAPGSTGTGGTSSGTGNCTGLLQSLTCTVGGLLGGL